MVMLIECLHHILWDNLRLDSWDMWAVNISLYPLNYNVYNIYKTLSLDIKKMLWSYNSPVLLKGNMKRFASHD